MRFAIYQTDQAGRLVYQLIDTKKAAAAELRRIQREEDRRAIMIAVRDHEDAADKAKFYRPQ